MEEINYNIEQSFGVLSTSKSGWTTELNLVSWSGHPAKYDIRPWSPDHERMGKGITLTKDEIEALKGLLGNL